MTTKSPTPSTARQVDELTSMDLERVADALHFLDNTQPLAGCDFTDDDEFSAGRSHILRLLEQEVRRLALAGDDAPADDAAAVTP